MEKTHPSRRRLKNLAASIGMLALSFLLIGGVAAVRQRQWDRYERPVDTLPAIDRITPAPLDDLAAEDHVTALSYCYDRSGTLVAYRVEAQETGYNSEVPIVIASTVTPDAQVLIGIEVVKQKESEYYGARIATSEFSARFAGRRLPVFLTGDAGRGAHVDGVSGATFTSQAVVTAIEDARRFVKTHLVSD